MIPPSPGNNKTPLALLLASSFIIQIFTSSKFTLILRACITGAWMDERTGGLMDVTMDG